MTDLLIIGGGMAGLTAAIYALRAGKSVLLTEKETFGGQITSAPRVENYPGLPGVSGNQLTDAALSQALDLGLEIELENITSLRKAEDGTFAASTGKREYAAKAVILATGAKHRPLGIAREEELTGHGVSYCALCDGAFHKGEDVAVIGGGNSAAQAAVFLSDLCKSVTVIQNFDHFTCDQRDLNAMRARENIHFCLSSRVTALEGDERLRAVRLIHESGAASELPVTGLFVCIGRMADNAPFADLAALDAQGFILAGEDCCTSVPGLFAAGDCRTKAVRQLTTAAADGAIAATAACRYIG